MSTKSGWGGPGPPVLSPSPTTTTYNPDQTSRTSAWAGAGAPGGMRSFIQIIEDEKTNRNILEIHLSKIISTDTNGKPITPANLNFDDLGELIFDVLKIEASDCLSFDYNTGRYDYRTIKFKPGFNTDPHVT